MGRLKDAPGAQQNPHRVGRGPGSGRGKTSGRGHKGQKLVTASSPGSRVVKPLSTNYSLKEVSNLLLISPSMSTLVAYNISLTINVSTLLSLLPCAISMKPS